MLLTKIFSGVSYRLVLRQWLVDGRSKAVFISMMHMKVCTIILTLELRSCVKVELNVLGSHP